MCNFSIISKTRNYVRPDLVVGEPIIDIKNGRHPVVEKSLQNTGMMFTPNDCKLNNKISTWLMTGPNMAGKSTFLRQTAVIVLLNQIGCFVPADYARLSVFDKIFSRIGASFITSRGRATSINFLRRFITFT